MKIVKTIGRNETPDCNKTPLKELFTSVYTNLLQQPTCSQQDAIEFMILFVNSLINSHIPLEDYPYETNAIKLLNSNSTELGIPVIPNLQTAINILKQSGNDVDFAILNLQDKRIKIGL